MPGAEPWGGEGGGGVSQLRPPAVVCGENVQVLFTASTGTGLRF